MIFHIMQALRVVKDTAVRAVRRVLPKRKEGNGK